MAFEKTNLDSQDSMRVRKMTEKILETPSYSRNVSTENFLKWLVKYKGDDLLNPRQKEALFSLYQQSTKRAFIGRYSAAELLKLSFESRFNLNDEDQEKWLEERVSYRQRVYLTNEEWVRLISLCRILGIIYPDEWIYLEA